MNNSDSSLRRTVSEGQLDFSKPPGVIGLQHSSGAVKALCEEQLERIRRNRERALALRAFKSGLTVYHYPDEVNPLEFVCVVTNALL